MRALRLGHKSMGKNLVRNLQYGPRTWLVRAGIYNFVVSLLTFVLAVVSIVILFCKLFYYTCEQHFRMANMLGIPNDIPQESCKQGPLHNPPEATFYCHVGHCMLTNSIIVSYIQTYIPVHTNFILTPVINLQ